jgi:hypothetical protein
MPSQYARAIKGFGDVIQSISPHRPISARGFGARIDGEESHSFPLAADARDPMCKSIEGVLEAYRCKLTQVQLWGPTNFCPIISHAMKMVAMAKNSYIVLLMVTDGACNDLAATVEAIVCASRLPLSIMFVGVGAGSFSGKWERSFIFLSVCVCVCVCVCVSLETLALRSQTNKQTNKQTHTHTHTHTTHTPHTHHTHTHTHMHILSPKNFF